MLGYLRDRFPKVPAYCLMADTGFEHVRPIPAVDWTRTLCARFGVELTVVRNPNKTYLEMVRRRGRFPSAQFRQCTSDLKRGPIQKFVRQLRHPVLINCMGIRAEESTQRAKQTSWSPDLALSRSAKSGRPGRTVYNWLPIFHETTQEVLQWHWQSEVPMHPVYVPEYHSDGTTGGYLRRFSCRVCIFASDHDLRSIYQHDREAFDLVSQLETETGFTMKPSGSLVQILSSSVLSNSERQYNLFVRER